MISTKRNIIIIAAAAIILAGGATVFAVTHNSKSNSESVLTLAQRYLSEQNYKQAVIEFQKILEIDPLNAEAYLGLAEAYLGLGDTESAIAALRDGYEATGDAAILAKLDELTAQDSDETSEQDAAVSEKTENIPSEEVDDYVYAPITEVLDMIFEVMFNGGEANIEQLSTVTEFSVNYYPKYNGGETTFLKISAGNRNGEYYNLEKESAAGFMCTDTDFLKHMKNL
ncbi:MAG: tetratricopeptide repeat protein, partial [Oscillospiraceae bacterium]